jgi:hypothetical protein
MTPKEAYRIGFLTKIAEHGYTPSSLDVVLALKQASDSEVEGTMNVARGLWSAARGGSGALLEAASASKPYVAAGFFGIPLLGGMVTGKLQGALTDKSPDTVARFKQQDLINTYRAEASKIRKKLQRDKRRGAHKGRNMELTPEEGSVDVAEDLFG